MVVAEMGPYLGAGAVERRGEHFVNGNDRCGIRAPARRQHRPEVAGGGAVEVTERRVFGRRSVRIASIAWRCAGW